MKKLLTIMAIMFFVLTAIFTLYVLIYVVPTNAIMKEARDVFEGNIIVSEEHPLRIYNKFRGAENIQYSLSRVWVWHNGKTGYIQVIYSVKYFDGNEKVISASHGIPSRWNITKIDGKWQITDIDEPP